MVDGVDTLYHRCLDTFPTSTVRFPNDGLGACEVHSVPVVFYMHDTCVAGVVVEQRIPMLAHSGGQIPGCLPHIHLVASTTRDGVDTGTAVLCGWLLAPGEVSNGSGGAGDSL